MGIIGDPFSEHSPRIMQMDRLVSVYYIGDGYAMEETAAQAAKPHYAPMYEPLKFRHLRHNPPLPTSLIVEMHTSCRGRCSNDGVFMVVGHRIYFKGA